MTDASIIFNRKKLKYELLDSLFKNIKLTGNVNFIIDYRTLFDIFYIEFYHNIIPDLIKDSNSIVAEFFNYIAHYNNYLRKRYIKLNINFFLIYNESDFRETIYPELWEKKNSKGIKLNFLPFVLNKCLITSKYIKNVHIINSTNIDPHYSTYILLSKNKISANDTNIFISNDEFYFQYSNYMNNFYLLKASNDLGKLYSNNGYFRYIYEKNSYKNIDNIIYNDSLIPEVLAYKGYESILGLVNLKPKQYLTNIEKLYMLNKSKEEIFNELIPVNLQDEFNKRVNLLDISKYYNNYINYDDESAIDSSINMNKKNSTNILFDLNSNSFKDKINLEFLLS
jgi:hypothetical protein